MITVHISINNFAEKSENYPQNRRFVYIKLFKALYIIFNVDSSCVYSQIAVGNAVKKECLWFKLPGLLKKRACS